jgi:hypothetical protein
MHRDDRWACHAATSTELGDSFSGTTDCTSRRRTKSLNGKAAPGTDPHRDREEPRESVTRQTMADRIRKLRSQAVYALPAV